MIDIRFAKGITAVLVILWIILAWYFPLFDLSENQVLYTFSSEAQVIAAIYGLTITGYIFLRNKQDRLADRDETYIEILESIQSTQFQFITLITVISITSIFAALLAIIFRESSPIAIETVTQNLAAALFSASLVWTGLFVLDAMGPDQIAKASRVIRFRAEKTEVQQPPETQGKLEDFLLAFNAIERALEAFTRGHLDRPDYLFSDTYSFNSGASGRSSSRSIWTKPRIVRAMESQEVISPQLAKELVELIRYRNALVHGREMGVSAEMVDRMKSAENELLDEIQKYQSANWVRAP